MFEMYGSVFNTVYGIVLAFICAFFISVTSTPVVRTLAFKCGVTDIPKDNRRMHKKEMPLMGGAAIFLAFTVTVLIFCKPTVQTIAMLVGNLIIVITGIIDDKYDMNAFVKLFLQIAASVVAVGGGIVFEQINLFGYDIAFGSLAPVVTVLWITAITNAVNLIDGLDGLSCGVSTISATTLLFTLLRTDTDINVICMIAILVGACMGFLPFNFNPARIFMGDTGALFLGYTLSVLSVVGVFKSDMVLAFFIPLSIFGLPLADTCFAVIRRLAHGKSPFAPDRGHLHHRLIDMGFGQKQSVRILYAVCAILGISAVMLTGTSTRGGALMLVVGLAIFFVTFRILKNPKLRIHSGIYNEDEGVAPPIETFEDVIGEIPSITPEEAAAEAAAEEEELAEAAKAAAAGPAKEPACEEDESEPESDGQQ